MADIKLQALTAMAEAYYQRGVYVQYDERSLNRSGSVCDERRQKGMPPEYGTKQNTLHLDCSSFVYSVYYQTFGIELGSDLTEGLIELKDIRPFYYVVSHKETKEERDAVLKRFLDELRPGDAVINRRATEENGHIMLHVGEGRLLHCTSTGGGSYMYPERRDNFEKDGGIKEANIMDYFQEDEEGNPAQKSFFNEKISRFAILRPYNEDTEVLPNAIARVEGLQGIVVEKTNNIKPSHSVVAGDEIEYFIEVANRNPEFREVRICDSVPAGCELVRGCTNAYMMLAPWEKKMVSFAVRVAENAGEIIVADGLEVNGCKIAPLATIAGGRLSCEQKKELAKAVEDCACGCKWEFVKNAYNKAFGYKLPYNSTKEVLQNMFVESKIDTQILIPDRSNEIRKLMVPDLYGGKNVETNFAFKPVRVRETRECCFDGGDILVFCEEESFETSKVWLYLGEGRFVSAEGEKTGEEAYKLMQSLLGQYAFFVLRPALAM